MSIKKIDSKELIDGAVRIIMIPYNTTLGGGVIFTEKDNDILLFHDSKFPVIYRDCQYYHLYLVSNEEIKDGDLCADPFEKWIYKASSEEIEILNADLKNNVFGELTIRKIIASSDPDLNLPTFSKSFIIDTYIKSSGTIEIVDVDYSIQQIGQCGCRCHQEGYKRKHIRACCHPRTVKTLKVDYDNNIIINTESTPTSTPNYTIK